MMIGALPSRPIPLTIIVLILTLVLHADIRAQSHSEPTQLIWALDAAATPIIRVYDPAGAERFTIAVPGSGQARSLSIHKSGVAYVSRGDQVHELSASGVPTGLVLSPPSGASVAQHCIRLSTNALVVAFGTTVATSRIVIYSPVGAIVTTITDPALNHPRRLLADPGGTRVYVANRGANTILSFDSNLVIPLLSLTVDLNSQMIGPIGLAWDEPGLRFWVVGDHGQTQSIGTVTVASPAFSASFTYPPSTASGLTAPSGAFFDRFRLLYLAGRNQNSGTAGVYVFDARSSPPAFIKSFPTIGPAPTNIIDVFPAPGDIRTCVPLDGTTKIFVQSAMNPVTALNQVNFDCPAFPNHVYAAAMSFRWTPACSVSAVGTLVNPLRFGLPDTRGIPLIDDGLFFGSAGVPVPGPSPIPGGISLVDLFGPNMGIRITGFLGALDANGRATGFVDLTTVPVGAIIDDLEISLAWIVFDSTVASGIGFISRPECIKLRLAPAALVVCPP